MKLVTFIIILFILTGCSPKETSRKGSCFIINKEGKMSPVFDQLQYCTFWIQEGDEINISGSFKINE